jgi:hypothetical protein
MSGHPWVQQKKPKEFSNIIKSIITRSNNQGYTTQGQGGQTKFKWWFHILFSITRWRRQMLEVWWASQEKGLSQSTLSWNILLLHIRDLLGGINNYLLTLNILSFLVQLML